MYLWMWMGGQNTIQIFIPFIYKHKKAKSEEKKGWKCLFWYWYIWGFLTGKAIYIVGHSIVWIVESVVEHLMMFPPSWDAKKIHSLRVFYVKMKSLFNTCILRWIKNKMWKKQQMYRKDKHLQLKCPCYQQKCMIYC